MARNTQNADVVEVVEINAELLARYETVVELEAKFLGMLGDIDIAHAAMAGAKLQTPSEFAEAEAVDAGKLAAAYEKLLEERAEAARIKAEAEAEAARLAKRAELLETLPSMAGAEAAEAANTAFEAELSSINGDLQEMLEAIPSAIKARLALTDDGMLVWQAARTGTGQARGSYVSVGSGSFTYGTLRPYTFQLESTVDQVKLSNENGVLIDVWAQGKLGGKSQSGSFGSFAEAVKATLRKAGRLTGKSNVSVPALMRAGGFTVTAEAQVSHKIKA